MTAAVSSKNSFNVELLNSNNYHTWKFRMHVLFEEKGVYEFISSEYKDSDYAEERKRQDAKKKDNMCKSLIVQCLDDSQIDIIRGKETAYSMWKGLEERYEKKGIPGQLMLRRKLMAMKLIDVYKLEDFLAEFDLTINQLRATGADLRDQDIICNLLMAMPPSFETVVTILENSPSNILTLDFVKARLRSEVEKRKSLCNDDFKTDSVKPAAFNNINLSSIRGVCFGCGKRGHFKRDCRASQGQNFRGGNMGFQNARRGQRNYSQDGQEGINRSFRGRGFRRGLGRWFGQNSARNNNQNAERRGNYSESTEDGQRQMENISNGQGICFMSNIQGFESVSTNELLFYIDSGCTDHLINDKSYFTDIMFLENPIKIAVAKNGNYMEAVGVGNVKVISKINGREIKCTIKNAFYVPNLRKNLLSVKQLEMANIKIVFNNGQVCLYHENNLIGVGHRSNLYEIKFTVDKNECSNTEVENEITNIWHKRLGHICYSNLDKLVKNNMVVGLENVKLNKVEFCEACVGGKMTRLKFGTRTKARRLLEIVHTDIAGPITPASYDGDKYFVTFIDDYSNFVYVYVIKSKDKVVNCFKEYARMVQTKFNLNISLLRCDNGREYISNEMKSFCRENGTVIDFTNPYTPEQNGKAERFNRSLVDKARAMIKEACMPKEFWNEAVRVAAYTLNRSPSNANIGNMTPAEVWNNTKPDIRHMKVFGCTAYYHVPKQFRNKFDEKAKKGIMIGYTMTGYRLWDIENQKVVTSRDVVFNEKEYYYKKEVKIEIENEEDINNESNDEEKEEVEENDIRKERRNTKLPTKYVDYEMYMAFDAVSYVENVPERVKDLKGREDESFWINAMEKEIESIKTNNTWAEVEEPKNAEILTTKWVFAFKPLEEKIEDRYKARLVVRGFAQHKSFDYDNLYSPVAKMSTIRTLLSLGNQQNFYFTQLDVKTAFLNGELKENVFIYPPEMIKCKDGNVLQLNKSLYGLKQASKCWNNKINNFLLKLGFIRSNADYCLYSIKYKDDNILYLLLYVDDIILTASDLGIIRKYKEYLMTEFDIKDKGKLKNFLGLEINYAKDEGILRISQKRYLTGILRRFNFENCNPVSTPIDPKFKISKNDIKNNSNKPVKELVGCLMYLMLGSRPDISFSINYLSRYQDSNPEEVWVGLKRLLRYLKGTLNIELKYERKINEMPLTCYVDSDWAGDLCDRKSVSGYLIKVFGNTVSWITRKQNCVALSSTEAELVALCSAMQDSLWFKKLLCDMNTNFASFKIFEDNLGCISLIKNPENNKRVKHIDLKYNFICEHLISKAITLEYVNTKLQQADFLTKGLHKYQFYSNFERIGLEMREG